METKLCKDCKHLRVDMGYQFGAPPICEHPDAPIDPVYGRKNATCNLMRSTNCLIPQCGVDGDWFEQAPPTEPVELRPYQVVPVEAPHHFTLAERFARWIWGAKY